MNDKELNKLRNKLPRGYRKMIADTTGKHMNTVAAVLKGKYFNQEIIEAAISLAAEHQEALKKQRELIKSL